MCVHTSNLLKTYKFLRIQSIINLLFSLFLPLLFAFHSNDGFVRRHILGTSNEGLICPHIHLIIYYTFEHIYGDLILNIIQFIEFKKIK